MAAEDAYKAYRLAAKTLHGEFANTGHVSDVENGNNVIS